jgi:hypothetical protein
MASPKELFEKAVEAQRKAKERLTGMARTGEWFESIAEAQRKAKKRLPKSVYMALIAGTEKGDTLADNEAAFSELGFVPHVVGYPEERDMR